MEHFWPESNGHAHPVKYESDAAVSGFQYCNDAGLNFATSAAGYSEDDTEYPSGRRGKASRQDPLSHRIIEKRRRDRMNSCLADLSRLIPPQYQRKGRGRIEKTEIIEMAIRHMKYLQHQECALHEYEYRAGYRACLEQAVKFLNERHLKDVSSQIAPHLNEHCEEIMDNRKGVTSEYFKGRGASNTTPAPLAINNSNSHSVNGMSNGMMSSASIMMMDSVSGSSSRSPPMAPAPAHQHQPSFHATTPSTTTTTPTATSEDNNNNNNSHHSLHHHHSTDSNDEELVLAKDLSFRGSQPHQAAVITSTPPAHLLPHAVVDYETTSTSTNATTVTIGSQSDNEKPTTFVKMPSLVPQLPQQQSKKRHHEVDDVDTDDDHHSLLHNSLSHHQLDQNNYKFKNYIQQRFTQDAYFKEDTDEDDHHHHHIEKIDEIMKKSKNKKQQVPVSSSSSTMPHHRKNIRVPIFALHASGSFYIPLQIDYEALTPFLNGHDLLDAATSQIQAAMLAMHPVNINVCFQTSHHVQTITPINGLTNGMKAPGAEFFARPKIELTNGW